MQRILSDVRRSRVLFFAMALLTVSGLGLSSAANSGPSPSPNQVADNDATVWGGEHIQLKLTKDGGTVQFDCATGTITKPLTVNAQGNFRANGTYTRENPGPITGEGNPAANATYSGSIVGGAMRLHIVAGANKEVVGDFGLVRGESGRVVKCR